MNKVLYGIGLVIGLGIAGIVVWHRNLDEFMDNLGILPEECDEND